MLNRFGPISAILFVLCIISLPALAETETPITIYVTAESGKALGAISGESQVVLRDRTSGDVFASGQTYNGKFDVSVDLPRPAITTISVTGPLTSMAHAVTTSRDVLLIPGKDYSANGGIGIVLPGAFVDMLAPAPDQTMSANLSDEVLVTAYVAGLDGQPATAATHEVDAVVYRGSVVLGNSRMVEMKEPGRFGTKLKFPNDGTYNIVVTAYSPAGKSAGMDQSVFVVTKSTEKPADTPDGKKK